MSSKRSALRSPRERSLLWRLLLQFSLRRRWQFALVVACTLVGALAELIGIGAVVPFLQLVAAPQTMEKHAIVQDAIGWVGGSTVADLIIPSALLLTIAAIVSAAARIGLIYITQRFNDALTHDLAMRIFGRTIRQPYGEYVRRNSIEVLAAIEKVNYVGAYLINPLLQAMSATLISFAIMAFLLSVDAVAATIAAVVMGGAYFLIGSITRPILLRLGKRQTRLATERLKLAQESLGGIRDIILDRSHTTFERQYELVDLEFRRIGTKSSFASAAPRYAIEAMAIILIAVLAVYFTTRPGGVVGAVPVLGALALGAQRLLPLLQQLNTAWVQSASSTGLLVDVFALLDLPVLPDSPAGEPPPIPFVKSLELVDLGFNYDRGVAALADVRLSIIKGMRVGFIGRTGSGKSTLLDVIMGLLNPTVGQIRVDGIALDPMTITRWQARIAHVPQAIFLTDDTIAANIAFGQPRHAIDLARVEKAAAAADVASFIDTLPSGYDTKVGERGIRLSGGQRQRIGIARALYKQADVLILDEATSALDDSTEAAVMDEIEKLDRSLTILIIAHRLSTVAKCDLVVRLEHGRVTATGSYAEVAHAKPARR